MSNTAVRETLSGLGFEIHEYPSGKLIRVSIRGGDWLGDEASDADRARNGAAYARVDSELARIQAAVKPLGWGARLTGSGRTVAGTSYEDIEVFEATNGQRR